MARAVFHCELAWLGGDAPTRDVRVDVEDGTIASVEAGVAPPPEASRLTGLTLPGLANAHSHAFHRALRGRTQAGAGTFWTWRDDMYRLAATLDPERGILPRAHSEARRAPTSSESSRVSVRTESCAQKTPVSQRWARQTATAMIPAPMMALTFSADSRGLRNRMRTAGQSRFEPCQ